MIDITLFEELKKYLTKEFMSLSGKKDEKLAEKMMLEVERKQKEQQLFDNMDTSRIKRLFSPLDDEIFEKEDFSSYRNDKILQNIQKIENEVAEMDVSMGDIKKYLCFIQMLENDSLAEKNRLSDKEQEQIDSELEYCVEHIENNSLQNKNDNSQNNHDRTKEDETIHGSNHLEVKSSFDNIEKKKGSFDDMEEEEERGSSDDVEMEEKRDSSDDVEMEEERDSSDDIVKKEKKDSDSFHDRKSETENEPMVSNKGLEKKEVVKDKKDISSSIKETLEDTAAFLQERYSDTEILIDFEDYGIVTGKDLNRYFIRVLTYTISASIEAAKVDTVIVEGEIANGKITVSLQMLLENNLVDQYSYQYEILLKEDIRS